MEDLRFALNQTTFETAVKTLPFGTGLGSFVRVYATVEKKEDAFAGFANRAHNDAAELLLETGVLGAASASGVSGLVCQVHLPRLDARGSRSVLG